MIKVLHVITGLGSGGAEITLLRLLSGMDKSKFTAQVLSLLPLGILEGKIRALGVDVVSLGMRQGVPNPAAVWRAKVVFGKFKPDVVQGWMYHANLLSGIVGALSGRVPVVWGIHHTTLPLFEAKLQTILTSRICAVSSRYLARRIVCCAESALRVHESIGYDSSKMVVITNGLDYLNYKQDKESGLALRTKLGIPPHTPIIAHVARYHPQKNHVGFLEAVAIVQRRIPEVHAVLCGDGVTYQNSVLKNAVSRLEMDANLVHLIGRQDSVQGLLSTSCLAVSSSCGEAFPVTLCEAMACGALCITTDVGDCSSMVRGHGRVVPPLDPTSMAEACIEMILLPPEKANEIRRTARRHVQQNYSLIGMVSRYESIYQDLAEEATPSQRM